VKELELMQRQQQLANDLWQQLITIEEFTAGMDKLNVETENFQTSARPNKRTVQRPNTGQRALDYDENINVEESELADLRRRAGILHT